MMILFSTLRHAARGLARRPLASATAVLTLALALAAGAVLLCIVHALYLAPLPWTNQDRLAYVGTEMNRIGIADAQMSWGLMHEFDDLASLDAIAAYRSGRVAVRRGELPESVQVVRAEAALLPLLGADTVGYGRGFSAAEVRSGEAVVVLGDAQAREWYGSADAALGQEVVIDDRGHRIIGVLRAGAEFPDRNRRMVLPLQRPAASDEVDGSFGAIEAIGLLAADSADTQALTSEMSAVLDRLIETSPDMRGARDVTGLSIRARDWREHRLGDVGATLALLAAALAGLLVLAAGNVSNVLMERVASRRGELAVRLALGASRRRLLALVLADALVLSLLGWLLGVGLAIALVTSLAHWLWLDSVVAAGVAVTAAPIGMSLLLMVALSLLTAVFPALTVARMDAGRTSLSQRGGSDGRGRRIRRILVAGQAAFSLSLLVVAVLLARSLLALWQIDPGFSRTGVLTAEIEPGGARYEEPAARTALALELIERMAAVPGVTAVAVSDGLPFASGYSMSSYEVEDLTVPEQPPVAYNSVVSSDYFPAMGMRLVAGRGFSEREQRERDQATAVAIVDEALARRYFQERDPIGHRLRFIGSDEWREIVGVVGSVVQADLADAGDAGQIYLPLSAHAPRAFSLVVRSGLPAGSLIPVLRDTLAGIDAGVPVRRVLSMEERLDNSLADRTGPMKVVVFFAALALLLAGIGLYGLLATAVIERRAEIGVRMALGADRRRIVRTVMGDGLRLVLAGLAAGTLIALLAVPLLRHHLYGVSVADPVSFVLAAGTLLAIAAIAAAVPAWRAARVAPGVALRGE